MESDIRRLFNDYRTISQLHAIADPDAEIVERQRDAVRAYKNREWAVCTRNIGIAAEDLMIRLCDDLYDRDDISDQMGGKLRTVTNGESGLPKFIAHTLASAWWLRNQESHPRKDDVSREDAHFALLCFQMALEKYVEEYLKEEVVY